jgi:hypothetical protein
VAENTIKQHLPEWRKDALPLLLFLVLPLLAFPELFLGENTVYRGDLTWIHYPQRTLAAEQWKSGQVPLWNPYVLSGTPLLAEAEIGVLQPLNAVFLLPIPPYRALTLFVALNLTLAATFTYILARSLGIGRGGATLAGLSFGFGGFLMAHVTELNVMTGGVWLPLVFWGLSRALRTRRPVDALLGGLPLGLYILAAHPQMWLYTLLLLIGYALYETVRIIFRSAPAASHSRDCLESQEARSIGPCARYAQRPQGAELRLRLRETARVWVLLGLLTACGLMVAAPQILPSWELQRLSVRAAGAESGQQTFSLPPVQWLTLALPSAFGNSVTAYHGLAGNFEETNVYIGILPLLMVPFSWRARRRPEVRFFWLAALASAVLAVGNYLPLYDWLQSIPGFNLFRAPVRWSMVTNLALSLLAAYGFDAFLLWPASRRLRLGLLGVWGGVAVGLFAVWLFRQPLYAWTQTLPADNHVVHTLDWFTRDGLFEIPEDYGSRIILGPFPWLVTPALALVSRLGIAVALLVAYAARHLPRPALVGAALALVAVDMSLAGGTAVNRITSADHWQQMSEGSRYMIDALDAGQIQTPARFYSVASSGEADVVIGLKHYFPSVRHVFGSGGHSSLRLARYDTFLQQAHPLVMLSLTNTRFLINKGRLTPDAESVLPLVYQDGTWYVYENPGVLPRAFVAHQAQAVANAQEALAPLRGRSFDARRLVLLETPETGEPLPPLPAGAAGLSGDDRVAITRYAPSEVEIRADTQAAGFLVLLDNYYPGWEVTVDGQRRTVIRADYFARAVYLDKGQHTVEFVYRPLSFRIGVGLSAAALVVLGVAGWLARKTQPTYNP